MKTEMAKFALEMAMKSVEVNLRGAELGIFEPYKQFPSYQRRLPYMDRPFGPGYETRPDLSRWRPMAAFNIITAPARVPAAVVVGSAVGATLIHQAHKRFEPVEPVEKQGYWQTIAQMLTGGVGVGSWTSYQL